MVRAPSTRGVSWRPWRLGACDGGMHSRQERAHGPCGARGGMNSRREGLSMNESGQGLESRARILQAELEQLNQRLRGEKSLATEDRRMSSGYWQHPWKEASEDTDQCQQEK